jgi:hypothetical protein
MQILNASAYEHPLLMAALFIGGTVIIFLMIALPTEQTKAPMHYYVKKRELPQDEHYERASYIWLGIIALIVIYYFI